MKILIPVDDERFAQAMSEFVVNHTWPQNVEFKILYVYESVFLQEFVTPLAVQQLEAESSHKQMLGRAIVTYVGTRLRLKFANAEIEEKLQEGDAKLVILDTIKEWQPDLVVIGSHNKGMMERFFLGSVSLAVLTHAPCSVLTVKIPN